MLQVQLQSQDPVYLDMAFECQNGQLLALVGPSGSGKTSALRAIAGLLPVASGKIGIGDTTWLDTENNLFIPPTKRSIGMVFQNYALFPHLTAYQNIELALPSHLTQEYVEGLLKDMGLMDLQKRYPHELSGGQRQRVALARAFARQPKVLLLDEAFSAVDHPTRKILYEELIKLLAKKFDVAKSSIRIKSGTTSRQKVIEIDGIYGNYQLPITHLAQLLGMIFYLQTFTQ
jgi:molybdate transport system ATP-binding protein